MKSDEAKAVGTVAGGGLRTLTRMIRGAHLATSNGVHDVVEAFVGPAAAPSRVVMTTVAGGVYAATGLGLDLLARGAGLVAGQRLKGADERRASLHDGPAAHHAVAIGLGLWGDSVARDAAAVAPAMHVRAGGRRVDLTSTAVAQAFSEATPDLAVFLHGLFETEAAWGLGGPDRPSYAVRLRRDLGLTPVLVRFNSGLRVSDNGAALDALLDDLVATWPVPVRRIVLIGHSMGGLVLHSALAVAGDRAGTVEEAPRWLPLVSDTVSLGTPHHGSPVARGVAAASARLGSWEGSRWVADVLRLRSGGIRDLEHGNVVAADWRDHGPDDRADRRTHPWPADGIRHRAVVAVTTSGFVPSHVSEVVGDFLVPVASGTHAGEVQQVRRFRDEDVAVVRGVGHLGLLNTDAAYDAMRGWLDH